MGLIDQAPADQTAPPEQAASMPAPPANPAVNMSALDRVVAAGLKLLYSPSTRQQLMTGLTREAPPDDVLAMEMTGVMKMMIDQSKGKMPANVIAPAADILTIDLADFANKSGLMKIDAKTLLSARNKTALGVAKVSGVLDAMKGQQGQEQPPPAQQPPQQPAGLIDQGVAA